MGMIKITSTAVSWDCGLDILAFDADELCVLAAIDAAREPAEAACRAEEEKAPETGNSTAFSSSHMVCAGSAVFAWRAIIVVASDVDYSGSLGLLEAIGRGLSVARGSVSRRSISRGRCSIARLSVHHVLKLLISKILQLTQ